MADNKVVSLSAFDINNPAANLSVVNTPRPSPGPGQVLVRLTLRPCNPADIFSIQGVYPGFTPKTLPAVPGLEGLGIVTENGTGASKFTIGQRVVGMPFETVQTGSGTWQQYIVVGEDCLLAVPDTVGDEAAAVFWINPVTVVGMLEVLAVPKGEYLLQTAAGSVLGRQIIQLAKHQGVKTINVVRRAEQAAELKALGADEVVVSVAGEGLVERVHELTGGKGAYAAIECVGGELFAKVGNALRMNGTVIMYGAMSGLTSTFYIPDCLFRNITIRGFWLMPWTAGMEPAEKERVCKSVLQLLADKVLTPYAGQRFALDNIVEAVGAATSAARGGKVLIEG